MTNKDINLEQKIAYEGLIGEIVHEKQPDGRMFEFYRRSPGVRIVIVSSDNKILLTKEHRRETDGIDLRLPGGKVSDTLAQYRELLESGISIEEVSRQTAVTEALEETGYKIHDPKLLVVANNGTTVEWDLYYFIVNNYSESPTGQRLGVGENIEIVWMNPKQIRMAIKNHEMREWRTVGVLMGLVLDQLED